MCVYIIYIQHLIVILFSKLSSPFFLYMVYLLKGIYFLLLTRHLRNYNLLDECKKKMSIKAIKQLP